MLLTRKKEKETRFFAREDDYATVSESCLAGRACESATSAPVPLRMFNSVILLEMPRQHFLAVDYNTAAPEYRLDGLLPTDLNATSWAADYIHRRILKLAKDWRRCIQACSRQ